MSLNLWNREDVARILVALTSAGKAHGSEYHEALRDVALAFGVTVEWLSALYPRSRLIEGEWNTR